MSSKEEEEEEEEEEVVVSQETTATESKEALAGDDDAEEDLFAADDDDDDEHSQKEKQEETVKTEERQSSKEEQTKELHVKTEEPPKAAEAEADPPSSAAATVSEEPPAKKIKVEASSNVANLDSPIAKKKRFQSDGSLTAPQPVDRAAQFGLPPGVVVPPTVTAVLLHGRLLETLQALPSSLQTEALNEFHDAVHIKKDIRNPGGYLFGVLKRYTQVHERALREGSAILPMGPNLTPLIHSRLDKMVANGFCSPQEMDDKIRSKIRGLCEKDAILALDELEIQGRGNIQHLGSFFMGIMTRYMRGDHTNNTPDHRRQGNAGGRGGRGGRSLGFEQGLKGPGGGGGRGFDSRNNYGGNRRRSDGGNYDPYQPPPHQHQGAGSYGPGPYGPSDGVGGYPPQSRQQQQPLPPFMQQQQADGPSYQQQQIPPQSYQQQQPPQQSGPPNTNAYAPSNPYQPQQQLGHYGPGYGATSNPQQQQQQQYGQQQPATASNHQYGPPQQGSSGMPYGGQIPNNNSYSGQAPYGAQPPPQQQQQQSLPPYGGNAYGAQQQQQQYGQRGSGMVGGRRRTTARLDELPVNVQFMVQGLVSSGVIPSLDEGILGMIFDLPEQMALESLGRFSSIDKSTMRNPTGYLAGVLRRELEKIQKR